MHIMQLPITDLLFLMKRSMLFHLASVSAGPDRP